MRRDWRVLTSVINLRRYAADVVGLCDLMIHGNPTEFTHAKQQLTRRLIHLKVHTERAQEALGETP